MRTSSELTKSVKKNENKNDNKSTEIEVKSFVVIHVNVDVIESFTNESNYLFRFSWILNYDFDIHVVNKTMK